MSGRMDLLVYRIESLLLHLGTAWGHRLSAFEPTGRLLDMGLDACFRYHKRHRTRFWRFIEAVANAAKEREGK